MLLDGFMKVAGVLLLVLAASHVFFPRKFQWKEQLRGLSIFNRQMFVVHSFFLALVLIGFGLLDLCLTEELLNPDPLARAIVAGMAVFWLLRLLVQLFVYDSSLWKGNSHRTVIHILFVLFWTSLVLIHGLAFLQ